MPYNDFGSAINLSAKMNDVFFSAKIIKNKKKCKECSHLLPRIFLC